MNQISELQSLFSELVQKSSQLFGVMLISAEGLPLIAALDSNLDEEQTAAIASKMLFWGDKLLKEINQAEINRIILEGAEGYCILVNCQNEIFLLAVASKKIVKRSLVREINRLVKEVQSRYQVGRLTNG